MESPTNGNFALIPTSKRYDRLAAAGLMQDSACFIVYTELFHHIDFSNRLQGLTYCISQTRIAEILGRTRRWVSRAISKLVDGDVIAIQKSGNKLICYQIYALRDYYVVNQPHETDSSHIPDLVPRVPRVECETPVSHNVSKQPHSETDSSHIPSDACETDSSHNVSKQPHSETDSSHMGVTEKLHVRQIGPPCETDSSHILAFSSRKKKETPGIEALPGVPQGGDSSLSSDARGFLKTEKTKEELLTEFEAASDLIGIAKSYAAGLADNFHRTYLSPKSSIHSKPYVSKTYFYGQIVSMYSDPEMVTAFSDEKVRLKMSYEVYRRILVELNYQSYDQIMSPHWFSKSKQGIEIVEAKRKDVIRSKKPYKGPILDGEPNHFKPISKLLQNDT